MKRDKEANTHTDTHTHTQTIRLLDRIGPVGRFDEKGEVAGTIKRPGYRARDNIGELTGPRRR